MGNNSIQQQRQEKQQKQARDQLRNLQDENKRFSKEAGPLNEELAESQRYMLELQQEKTEMEGMILTLQKNIKTKQATYVYGHKARLPTPRLNA